MTRPREVSQLTTAKLETARRQLRANLGLLTPGSPAHVPILAHIQAIDAELAGRAVGLAAWREPALRQRDASGPPPPLGPAGRDRGVHEPPARAGLDAERNQG